MVVVRVAYFARVRYVERNSNERSMRYREIERSRWREGDMLMVRDVREPVWCVVA